ncbi:MalY/PatB family protein [Arsenicicoccus dermatophilus]|uniref:MalY/PatB family protein n=1 Tax=Arsenicicoccus dermatophilus TaxID=1076331 RepID=UPI001F4C78E9|nr:aminotransferase class I/II-fold pyridoxal phosphate-dependent enzyme [Arsenicicoccus dermatophilus]MCH8612266.1 aminotransferase class I/II-fold pyridoxal phosphate-dependent enzyme [Arsenicicoccus dermatophilus]
MSLVRWPALDQLRERTSAKWSLYEPDVLPMTVAEMDCALAPVVADALHEAISRGDTGYPSFGRGLQEAFAGFAERRWGWRVDESQATLCADVSVGIMAAMTALLDEGDTVVIMPPVYPPFFHYGAETGMRTVEVPLLLGDAGHAIDLDGIERELRAGARAVLLCHPHNPVGLVHPRAELAALAELVARHDACVISDEIHAPLTLPGTTFTPYLAVSDAAREHGVAMHAASKAWNIAGLKAALIVTDSATVRGRLAGGLPYELPYHAGQLGYLAAEAAYRGGDAWLDDLVTDLAAHHEQLRRGLPAGARVVAPARATFLTWVDVSGLGLGDDPAGRLLTDARLAVGIGAEFGARWHDHVRFNVGTGPAIIDEGLRRLAAVAGEDR